jgi:NitT/TauT family transport system substrate-binding protein
MDTLHIRFLRYSAFYSPLLLTLARHLRGEGLTATFDVVTPERTIADGFARGEVQVAQSAPFVSFAPSVRGDPPAFRHFALLNARDGFFVAGRSGPFDWPALAGKVVLADHFAQPLVMLRCALERHGVHGVTLIDAGDVASMERAFRDGHGDFVHLQGPAPQQLEADGVGVVGPSVGEAVGPVAFSSLCATPAWLATDQARAFLRAFRLGLAEADEGEPSEIARQIAPFLPHIDVVALERTVARYQRLQTWRHDLTIGPELYARTVGRFRWGGVIDANPRAEDVLAPLPDSDLAASARRSGG